MTLEELRIVIRSTRAYPYDILLFRESKRMQNSIIIGILLICVRQLVNPKPQSVPRNAGMHLYHDRWGLLVTIFHHTWIQWLIFQLKCERPLECPVSRCWIWEENAGYGRAIHQSTNRRVTIRMLSIIVLQHDCFLLQIHYFPGSWTVVCLSIDQQVHSTYNQAEVDYWWYLCASLFWCFSFFMNLFPSFCGMAMMFLSFFFLVVRKPSVFDLTDTINKTKKEKRRKKIAEKNSAEKTRIRTSKSSAWMAKRIRLLYSVVSSNMRIFRRGFTRWRIMGDDKGNGLQSRLMVIGDGFLRRLGWVAFILFSVVLIFRQWPMMKTWRWRWLQLV